MLKTGGKKVRNNLEAVSILHCSRTRSLRSEGVTKPRKERSEGQNFRLTMFQNLSQINDGVKGE